MRRTPALDAVRGLAILMVLTWHYMPESPPIAPWIFYSTRLFWSGVDMFFVLSGFLISYTLIQNSKAQNYFSVFYLRRGARILPLYFLLFLFFYFIQRFDVQLFYKSYKNHLPLWAYLTFTQNFLYAARGRFADPLMDITWSLAVEEQFYVFLSVLIRFMDRKKIIMLAILLIVLAPILRFNSTHLAAYILPYNRIDSLMWGVLLALAWGQEVARTFLLKSGIYIKGVFIILFAGFIYMSYRNLSFGDPLAHSILGGFYTTVILLALCINPSGHLNLFGTNFLQWLGERSYGVYLLHRPVMIFVIGVLGSNSTHKIGPWSLVVICTSLTLMLSELSYRGLEKPFIRLGHYFKYQAPEAPPPSSRRDV